MSGQCFFGTMSNKETKKAAREREITKAYLDCQNISYSEISSLRPPEPDILVRTVDSTEMRFELVELTDPNERSTTGSWQKAFAQLHKIHDSKLSISLRNSFDDVFSDAVFKVDVSKNLRSIKGAYTEFLVQFTNDPNRFRNFVGDPNSSNTILSGIFEIVRIDGLTTPSPFATGMSYWVDQTHKAVSGKFRKPYAENSDVTILAYWESQFLPGNLAGVQAKLSEIVQLEPNKNKVSVIGFDMVNPQVFFDHRAEIQPINN